jgi:hypothetical protein
LTIKTKPFDAADYSPTEIHDSISIVARAVGKHLATGPADVAEHLDCSETQAAFLRSALATGNAWHIQRALSIVMRARRNRHIGPAFDDFLREEGILAEVTETAQRHVREWQTKENKK